METPVVERLQRDIAILATPIRRYGKGGIRIGHASLGELEAADLFGHRFYEGERSFDLMGALAFGKMFSSGVGAGISGNYLQRRIKDVTSPSLIVDIGLYYHTHIPGLMVIAADETTSGVHQLRSSRSFLPRSFRLGFSWRHTERLQWILDWHRPYRDQPFISTGAQLKPLPWLSLRGGVGLSGAYTVSLGVQFGQPFIHIPHHSF
ncbi:MAG: hypothetical protein HYZ73_08990 [Elusimicrobia bacterium]|nr:hypothetical protein [Elusimicrobiota bacterium]